MPSCLTCGHDHNYERGEICGLCGHSPTSLPVVVSSPILQEILSPYLFLGSYHDAFRLLNVENVSPFTHYLIDVPSVFVPVHRRRIRGLRFHILTDEVNAQFDEAFDFIRECERVGGMVLVYCMTGIGRSAAVVIAYLMKLRSWPLREALGWLRHRRPQINITPDLMQQLEEYEQKIFPNGITNGNVKHH